MENIPLLRLYEFNTKETGRFIFASDEKLNEDAFPVSSLREIPLGDGPVVFLGRHPYIWPWVITLLMAFGTAVMNELGTKLVDSLFKSGKSTEEFVQKLVEAIANIVKQQLDMHFIDQYTGQLDGWAKIMSEYNISPETHKGDLLPLSEQVEVILSELQGFIPRYQSAAFAYVGGTFLRMGVLEQLALNSKNKADWTILSNFAQDSSTYTSSCIEPLRQLNEQRVTPVKEVEPPRWIHIGVPSEGQGYYSHTLQYFCDGQSKGITFNDDDGPSPHENDRDPQLQQMRAQDYAMIRADFAQNVEQPLRTSISLMDQIHAKFAKKK
jgi:hypothetical protein